MQLSDGGQGDVPVDENKLHGKPDKTLRFSLCSDNLEGISEGEGLLHSRSCVIEVVFCLCSLKEPYKLQLIPSVPLTEESNEIFL